MRRLLIVALTLVLLLGGSTGCTMSQVQYVELTSGQGVTATVAIGHIHANSWGLYAFAELPFVAGGLDQDGWPVWRYFTDVVRVETAVALVEAEAVRRGATHLVDLQTDWLSEWSPTSLIFWIFEVEASATAIRVTGDAPAGAIPLAVPEG